MSGSPDANKCLFIDTYVPSIQVAMSPSAAPASRTYSIASIPADGIGPEVIDAAITVLKTLSDTLGSFDIDFTHFDWSSETYKRTGKYIPDGGLDELRKHDAILFGAVGAPGKYSLTNIKAQPVQHMLTSHQRCAGPYLPLGSPSRNLSALPAVCKCEADQGLPRHPIAAPELQDRRLRLGHCPREFGGRICRTRRS